MPKLTIEFADPKFTVGDFIRYETYGHRYVVRIDNVFFSGEWEWDGLVASWDFSTYGNVYLATCQEGCECCVDSNPISIRPGTSRAIEIRELEESGSKVDYNGQVWEPDTSNNLAERLKAWEEKRLQPKQESQT